MVKIFGDFEFDDRRRRLKARGQPLWLSGQAVDLLSLLLELPGELIAREEIERRLWPDRNVDFHHSLDVVVNRLRSVLGDKGASPRYIETVPRKGYRFIEPVTVSLEGPRTTAPRGWPPQFLTYAAVRFWQRFSRFCLRASGMTSGFYLSAQKHHRQSPLDKTELF